jgi:hypothetical protein
VSETVSGYSFRPADLKASQRRPGIGAFMRIRNGADFLERTILSHIDFFDEIVAVHNQCTDATPDILARLQRTYGAKLRVFRYTDPVFSPGTTGHAATPPDSPRSMVNYSNFALAMTTTRTVTKLDDDHLAIGKAVARVVKELRQKGGAGDDMLSFSGINLIARKEGGFGIPKQDPLSGSGDIGFFDVTGETVFTHDRRFERVPRPAGKRRFRGFLYWHLKYLKTGLGFANYDLEENKDSRFARRKERLETRREVLSLEELRRSQRPDLVMRGLALTGQKKQIALDRARALATEFPDDSLEAALKRTVAPEFLVGIV